MSGEDETSRTHLMQRICSQVLNMQLNLSLCSFVQLLLVPYNGGTMYTDNLIWMQIFIEPFEIKCGGVQSQNNTNCATVHIQTGQTLCTSLLKYSFCWLGRVKLAYRFFSKSCSVSQRRLFTLQPHTYTHTHTHTHSGGKGDPIIRA